MFPKTPLTNVGRERGVSLILTLVLLVVIGLTAASAMKSAVSSERVINNLRAESLAQQYAETALRYCEGQLALPSASRVLSLQDSQLTPTVAITAASWQQSSTWTATPTAVTTMDAALYYNATNSTFQVATAPQCLVNRVTLAGGSTSFVVTARGFSPDYRRNPDGTTASGSVVWIQSMLAMN